MSSSTRSGAPDAADAMHDHLYTQAAMHFGDVIMPRNVSSLLAFKSSGGIMLDSQLRRLADLLEVKHGVKPDRHGAHRVSRRMQGMQLV
ncbi:hypothetical protein BDK51DRAFT_44176 [Blyttiomyces helicus]|uniref:Uncharacterized protein n=1 Tax=Blyttiomyces helicus TaxID=388810 RepID=A0A4P9W2H3_9FUNG|nr:hypothetical protein BDK51DRAFT_44176 [Blyttiomyces helicus]|eukprot:RKO84800.1 hypothetical protein BDK51DRAFT_44176 [Blyttiomyces helicus]